MDRNVVFYDFSKGGSRKIEFNVTSKVFRCLFICHKRNYIEKDIILNLEKRNIKCEVFGLVIGKGKEQFNIRMKINHKVAHTFSRAVVKAVLYDESEFSFFGKIKIGRNSPKSDAFLEQNTLLIGEKSSINSTPQLEIETDDVKCSHAVTISAPDDEQLFYLTSRGMSEKKALNLLVGGFLKDVKYKGY